MCAKAKHPKHSHNSDSTEKGKTTFHLIHGDVWGPAPSSDIHGFKWFLLCVGDFNRFMARFLTSPALPFPKQNLDEYMEMSDTRGKEEEELSSLSH